LGRERMTGDAVVQVRAGVHKVVDFFPGWAQEEGGRRKCKKRWADRGINGDI